MNSTKIYEPDEQDDDHFRMATWYGPQSTAHDDVPGTEKLEVQGGDNYFIVTSEGQSMEFDQEDLAGLKLMLDEYENWLEDHDDER
jgi:hypothetical protein